MNHIKTKRGQSELGPGVVVHADAASSSVHVVFVIYIAAEKPCYIRMVAQGGCQGHRKLQSQRAKHTATKPDFHLAEGLISWRVASPEGGGQCLG
jgi:hypothetical protein